MNPEEQVVLGLAQTYFRQLTELGEREIWIPKSALRITGTASEGGDRIPEVKAEPSLVRESAPSYGDSREKVLKAYYNEIKDCRKCSLCRTRTKFVFGEGNPRARLVFIGEAPGADEDLAGRPFVGAAGKLLTKIIENGLKMPREEVFICNILKCRPPGNRNPLPDEIEQCEPHLIRQLEIIRPKIICALGTFAAQTLLRTKAPISALRGQIHYYQDIKVIPTYHPAALLRNPGWKRYVWEDIQLLGREYERKVASESKDA
jgi:uracil-DNA glycosylase family 4